MTCTTSSWRCPVCGSPLLTDGRVVVCSFIGGIGVDREKIAACLYGVSERITVEQHFKERPAPERHLAEPEYAKERE